VKKSIFKNQTLIIGIIICLSLIIWQVWRFNNNSSIFSKGQNSNSTSSRILFIISASPSPSPIPVYPRLSPAPSVVKAVYLTSYSAGNPQKIDEIIKLIDETELNGVVIDIKDYTGKVAFETQSDLLKNLNAEEIKIKDFDLLVKRFHEHNIYVITRIAVFQDLNLVKQKPEVAVKNKFTGGIWKDRKGISWVDPASKFVWDYNVEVAKQAINLGVDEINFDYIRFPSDGDMKALAYPVFDESQLSKSQQLEKFFKYLNENLKPTGVKLSVDLFGLSTINNDDLGIGQKIEPAYLYFDYVCPMVYPSHYAKGFIGYQNPAQYPYEVIDYSLEKALIKRENLIKEMASTTPDFATSSIGILRPWLQAFDLGADYTPQMIRKEIQAVYDNNLYYGWYLWDPKNVYSPAIFQH